MKDFFLHVTGFFLLCSLLSSCTSSLPEEVVSLGHTDKCPEWTLAQLERNAPLFNHDTDTFTLQCALGLLRNSKGAPIHQTSSGSHICFLLADRTDTDQVRRERFASEGVRWAENALAENGKEDGDVYYYLAVNLGIAVKEHMALAVKNLDRLVSCLDKAIELSPDVNYGGPYRVLGMLYLKAPPWPRGIGDGDRALELLHEAVHRHPEHPKNQIFYAQALWELEGEDEKKEIQKHLEEGLRLMNQEQWKGAKDRWIDDLSYVAKEADIELPGHAEAE
jgi:tetratricopeptide (TPR) repeat protein